MKYERGDTEIIIEDGLEVEVDLSFHFGRDDQMSKLMTEKRPTIDTIGPITLLSSAVNPAHIIIL